VGKDLANLRLIYIFHWSGCTKFLPNPIRKGLEQFIKPTDKLDAITGLHDWVHIVNHQDVVLFYKSELMFVFSIPLVETFLDAKFNAESIAQLYVFAVDWDHVEAQPLLEDTPCDRLL
jgi:hypothetical protein